MDKMTTGFKKMFTFGDDKKKKNLPEAIEPRRIDKPRKAKTFTDVLDEDGAIEEYKFGMSKS